MQTITTIGFDIAKSVLIVTHEVTNSGSDRAQLANMAKQAKAVLETDTLEARVMNIVGNKQLMAAIVA